VDFNMAYRKEKEISTYSTAPMYGWGYGWGWGWGWGGTDVVVREITVGTLTVDMVDAKRGQLAWRGLATKKVDDDEDPEDRDKHVFKAVSKIFKHYPPGYDDDDD
jgi:hypothetical protein